MEQQRILLGRIRERKLKYFGYVTRHNSLEKDVMLGPMPGLRRQDRVAKEDNGWM